MFVYLVIAFEWPLPSVFLLLLVLVVLGSSLPKTSLELCCWCINPGNSSEKEGDIVS